MGQHFVFFMKYFKHLGLVELHLDIDKIVICSIYTLRYIVNEGWKIDLQIYRMY